MVSNFPPTFPFLKVSERISDFIVLYTCHIFKEKWNPLHPLNFLKHTANWLGWMHLQQNINHLKTHLLLELPYKNT